MDGPYDRKVKPKSFKEGDLILKKSLHSKMIPDENSNQVEGPYVVGQVLSGWALYLSFIDGDSPHKLISSD